MNDYYYLVDKILNHNYCYCKDNKWRYYIDCELNNFKDVLIGTSKEIYEVKDSLTTDEQRYGFVSDNKWVKRLSQRQIYVLIEWDDNKNNWVVLKKVIANSYYKACELMAIGSFVNRMYYQVIDYSEVDKYEIKKQVDNFPLSLFKYN